MSNGLKIVLTGATRGLGASMLEGFAAQGCVVHGCGSNADGVARLAKSYPSPHSFTTVDVTKPDQVSRWAAEVLKSGAPDLLVNNAAVIHSPGKLWDLPSSEWKRVFDVNVIGLVGVCRAFVPAMAARRKGVIVNFSSTWGRSTSPDVSLYCASKFAVEGLTKSLAQELPQGMAAVALNPGVIATDMLAQVFGAAAASYPSPSAWGKRAVPFILGLKASDNGSSANVPGA